MLTQKAVVNIITITLFLLITLSAGVGTYKFITSKSNDFLTDIEKENTGLIQILEIEAIGNSYSEILVKYIGGYKNITKIELSNQECSIVKEITTDDLSILTLNCGLELENTYTIDLYTNLGVFSKTLSVLSKKAETSYTFRSGSCEPGETKLFGAHSDNQSHVELGSENNFGFSLCARHIFFNIGNSCSGNYEKLFFIGDSTNSHIWLNNSSPAPEPYLGYYNWNEVCISSSDATNLTINHSITQPSLNHVCLFGYEQDDFNGGVVGLCQNYDNKVWIEIE